MKKTILKAEDLDKNYSDTKIINNMNLEIYEGDFTVIMGSSGAGKSTLLYLLSGMDNVSNGSIYYNDKDISKFSEKQMSKLRTNDFGFVFQDSYLVDNLSLFENVAVSGYLGNKSKEEVDKNVESILHKMNIKDAKNRLPSNTSGGETQRSAIARSIINDPKILFADEPTGALNKTNSTEVLNLLTELNNAGQTIVMVTHDLTSSLRANRILYLEDGKIIGEKELSKYNSENLKSREEEINSWLEELKW